MFFLDDSIKEKGNDRSGESLEKNNGGEKNVADQTQGRDKRLISIKLFW